MSQPALAAALHFHERLQLSTANSPVTLQEFISHTKGIEYLIAILFLLLFPIFWKVLNQEKGDE